MEELIKKVVEWGKERGILENASAIAQSSKTLEEAVELNTAIIKDDDEGISDGIGDVLVTLILQCEIQGLRLEDCLQKAYDEIKGRKGKMVNGIFVKEEV